MLGEGVLGEGVQGEVTRWIPMTKWPVGLCASLEVSSLTSIGIEVAVNIVILCSLKPSSHTLVSATSSL